MISLPQVTYDISELDSPSLVSLRSSLLSAFRIFSVPGNRPILIQVCLALADLAVQMMEWTDVVHGLIEEFGKEVEMVPALLDFLRVLPEEVANPKITITVSSSSDAPFVVGRVVSAQEAEGEGRKGGRRKELE